MAKIYKAVMRQGLDHPGIAATGRGSSKRVALQRAAAAFAVYFQKGDYERPLAFTITLSVEEKGA